MSGRHPYAAVRNFYRWSLDPKASGGKISELNLGPVQAIAKNFAFDFFRNAFSREDALPVPQPPDARIAKSAAPVQDAGTMHPHLPANQENLYTLSSQEHNPCSFLDSIRYLRGINGGFQDKALRWRDHHRRCWA
jgi:hypothetical protein